MRSGIHGPKRRLDAALDDVQTENQRWWERTPMVYDWRSAAPAIRDLAWFAEQDRLSVDTHRFFATEHVPFDRLIPFAELDGKEVLEIGIGSGFHSELMAQAGARVTGIDLTANAIDTTRLRFELKGLTGRFEQCDAEHRRPDFERRFDFIWSWGVIHHSSRTARIVHNVSDWLTDDGRFAGMVYHRNSTRAATTLLWDGVCRLKLLSQSIDETLWRGADGFTARFYSAEQWRDLLLGFFDEASIQITGTEGDILPLPRVLRRRIIGLVSPQRGARILSRVGSFTCFDARNPLRPGR